MATFEPALAKTLCMEFQSEEQDISFIASSDMNFRLNDNNDTLEEGFTGLLSQDVFSSQDYCTPAQPQDTLECENQKTKLLCPLSPVKSTTLQNKRFRTDDFYGNTCDDVPARADRATRLRNDDYMSDETLNPERTVSGKRNYVSKSALSLRARVMSPPCIKNPYLTEDEELVEKIRRSMRPLPAYISPVQGEACMSRYRTDFQELEEIGRGDFSVVYKVLNRIDGCCYAIKRTQSPFHLDSERKKALMEVQALAALGSHRNLVGYYSAWFENAFLYIQMELCDYNLSSALDRGLLKTDRDFFEAMYQLAKALDYIHERGIAHLDVKPDNIFIHNGIYKLGDFGRATLLNGTLNVEEGDARYMSHEILNDNYEHLDKVDMFSLGATFYELLFRKQSPASDRHIERNTDIKVPILPGFSVYFQKLLQELMSNDPGKRPSAKCVLRNAIFNKIRAINEG